MRVEMIKLSTLKLWAGNPRKNDAAVPRLMELLKIHGQKAPIGVWERNRVIYKGNTTYKALMSLAKQWLKLESGQNTELFNQLRQGLVQVNWLSFPSEQAATAFGISDNKSSEYSEWDDDQLRNLLNAGEMTNAGAKQIGFTERELNAVRLSQEKPDKLKASDLEGEFETLGAFIVIQFENDIELNAFRKQFGLAATARAINYSVLKPRVR
jgi:hypothetical protein